MAQTGYTPILIYASGTATNVPLAANLTSSASGAELALNYADGKLFYKDSGGVVQTIAYKNVPISTLSGAGTGVLTALAVNTGTAGSFVVNGGALGTPSSGTVTNLTGTASININGTVGATTANTGAFTSITSTSASGILTRAAATQDGVALVGRAGGTSSFEVTVTPTTLTADRTLTLPDATTTVVGTNATQTLTNKRIDPRVSSTTSTASITPDISSFDQYAVTAQAATLTINAPIGTPVDGNKLIFRIIDNGTSQSLVWNATFTVIGVTLPLVTTSNKMTYVGCIYNAANTRWDVVAVTTQV